LDSCDFFFAGDLDNDDERDEGEETITSLIFRFPNLNCLAASGKFGDFGTRTFAFDDSLLDVLDFEFDDFGVKDLEFRDFGFEDNDLGVKDLEFGDFGFDDDDF
jgi:hypothetical protein